MTRTHFDISGLLASLEAVGRRLTQRSAEALKRGAEAVAERARATHTYNDRTGALTGSIQSDGLTRVSGRKMTAEASADAGHALYVEKGTRPHKIKAKPGKKLAFMAGGGMRFAQEVNHPGTEPYRFMEDALTHELPGITDELQRASGLAFQDAGFEVMQ